MSDQTELFYTIFMIPIIFLGIKNDSKKEKKKPLKYIKRTNAFKTDF